MSTGKYIGRVLVVDDDQAICEILRAQLSNEGFDCEVALSAEEGLSMLRRDAFDAVLSDLHMPGLSGLDFLAAARRERPHVAFLLVTGEQDVRTAIQAMKSGVSDYVVKPFKRETVLRSVGQAIEKKRLEAELQGYRQKLEHMVEERTRQLFSALQEIETTYDSTLEALGGALDLRDSATAGHSIRVTLYALTIAEAMNCGEKQLRELARAASLHDIGKIGIPDAVLLKAGCLTAEEQAIMRSHVLVGYELVSRIAFLAQAAAIVRAHHERYDGAGYPAGVSGDRIPLGARIFAVADTLDAMTSDRPYRKALSFEEAMAEIVAQSGRQFDPVVVKAFLSVPRHVWSSIQTGSLSVGRPRPRAEAVAMPEQRARPD